MGFPRTATQKRKNFDEKLTGRKSDAEFQTIQNFQKVRWLYFKCRNILQIYLNYFKCADCIEYPQ